MNDIETLVRESLRYDGDPTPMPVEPLVRRARRRRLTHRTAAAVGAAGIAAAATWLVWPQPVQVTAIEPAGPPASPSTLGRPVTVLSATDRVTTPAGVVIDVSPKQLCVGNTSEKPGCLLGANPVLDDPSTSYGWATSSSQDFVYAWLTPPTTTQATLQVGDAPAAQADLYRVEGRDLLIAVVTGHPCWGPGPVATELATDASGTVVYEHATNYGSCD